MRLTTFEFVFLSFAAFLASANAKVPCNVYYSRKTLDCSNQKLDSLLSPASWKSLTDIYSEFETGNFTWNRIKYVLPFPELDLKVLDLSNNVIEQIDQNFCSKLRKIESIDLSHNHIGSNGFMKSRIEDVLPVDTIAQRTLMNYEDPEDTSIMLLEPSLFLRTLNLGYNELGSFSPNTFEFCLYLEVLNLEHNSFAVIDPDTEMAIRSLWKLQELYLNGNQLKTIPTYMLLTMMSLHTLNLANNSVLYIPSGLKGTHVKSLTLDGNPIVRLTRENIFPVMTKLETLSMCDMPQLTEVGDNAFGNLKGLKTLFICNSKKFTKISKNAFWNGIQDDNVIKVEKIWLNNNSLSAIEEDLLDNWESMKEINLQDNDWLCSSNRFLVEKLRPIIERTTPALSFRLLCKDEHGSKVHMNEIARQYTGFFLESKASFLRYNIVITLLVVTLFYFCCNIL